MTRTLTPAALILGASLTAAPLAAQAFERVDCPTGSTRVGNDCLAPNGTVTYRFDMPQIEEGDVYDLTADGPYGLDRPEGGDKIVIEEDSMFITDIDTDLTVIAD